MFDQLLLQITNATVPVVAETNLFDQINAFASTLAVLVTTIGGIITYIVTKYRSVKKEDLTERDKWILEAIKTGQMAVQKGAENIGRSKEVMQIIYDANLSEEQKKKIEAKMIPFLQEADESMKAANEQAAMAKGKAVEIFGEAGDVDRDPTIPRESKEISQKLRKA